MEYGEGKHAVVYKVTRPWAYGSGYSQADKDWFKKSTSIHEGWHIYQYLSKLERKFRLPRAGPDGMLLAYPPELESAVAEAYWAYVEIEATIHQLTWLINTYKSMSATDPKRPSASLHAWAMRHTIMYMRENAEKLCATGVWDVITDKLAPDASLRVRFQNCKTQARTWYNSGATKIAEVSPGTTVPEWPAEEEEDD